MNDVLAELEAGRVPVRYRPAGGGRVLVVYVKDAGAAAALSDRLASEGADVVDRAGAVLRAGAATTGRGDPWRAAAETSGDRCG